MSWLAAVQLTNATSAQREVMDAIVGGARGRSLESLLATSAADWRVRSMPGDIIRTWEASEAYTFRKR